MAIRPALEADLASIVRIYNQAVERSTATFDLQPVTVSQRWPWFWRFGEDDPLLVHEDAKGNVEGYAYYLPYRSRPGYAQTKESSVYVDFEAHGRGIGRALMSALVEHARARQVHAMVAVLGDDNPASEALHRRVGFSPVGRLPQVGRKFDRWLDTTIWHMCLEPSS